MVGIVEWLPSVLALLLLALGLLCLITRRQVIQQVIGLSVMLQGALLAIVDAGRVNGEMALAQGMVVSALLVETVVLSIILSLVINIYHHHPDGSTDDIDSLKG